MPLDLLRTNPDVAVKMFGFFVETIPFFKQPTNSRCHIIASTKGDVVILHPVLGMGSDFFLPYVRARTCSIEVPKNVPVGTLVITPPMNGCTLEVRPLNNDANCFIHEAAGVNQPCPYIAKARIEESAYSMNGAAKNRALKFLDRNIDAYYCHTLICVKISDATWSVYHTQVAQDSKTGNSLYCIKQYSHNLLWNFKN
jgi:hypothetical protein